VKKEPSSIKEEPSGQQQQQQQQQQPAVKQEPRMSRENSELTLGMSSDQDANGVPTKGDVGPMDVDGPAAQRESELGCVSGELSEWTATDHSIHNLTGSTQQQQQQEMLQQG